jgi:hypothetical protein
LPAGTGVQAASSRFQRAKSARLSSHKPLFPFGITVPRLESGWKPLPRFADAALLVNLQGRWCEAAG